MANEEIAQLYNYNSLKIPINIVGKSIESSERSGRRQSSLNVTGSTIGKPTTGVRGGTSGARGGDYIGVATVGLANQPPPIQGESKAYLFDGAELQPYIAQPKDSSFRGWQKSHESAGSEQNGHSMDTKFDGLNHGNK